MELDYIHERRLSNIYQNAADSFWTKIRESLNFISSDIFSGVKASQTRHYLSGQMMMEDTKIWFCQANEMQKEYSTSHFRSETEFHVIISDLEIQL